MGVALAVTGLAALGLAAGVMEAFRARSTDALVDSGHLDDRVVVVGIDQRSLTEVGAPWPWPRDLHATLVTKLLAAGADVVVVDLLFNPAREGDDALAAAIDGRPVIVAATATGELRVEGGLGGLFLADSLTEPVPAIAQAAVVGHANVIRDPGDGVVRSVPLLVDTPEGRLVPSLSLATIELLEGDGRPPVIRGGGIQVAGRLVPTEDRGALILNFPVEMEASARGLPIVAASDVLNDRMGPERFDGKIVFVGATAVGLGDQVITPVAKPGMPGVLVHAAAVDTMLRRAYLVDVSRAETLAWVFLLAAIAAVAVETSRLRVIVPAVTVTLVGYPLMAIYRQSRGQVMDLVYPLTGAVLSLLAAMAIWYLTEGRRRRQVSTLFSQYVPEQVADQLLGGGLLESAVAGVRVEATVLFCDLRGFTAMSASLAPTDVRRALEEYYETMTRLVLDHGGTLMQYVGDEVYAVWGAPIPRSDHTDAAVRCALAMQAARFDVNRRLAAMHLPELRWGIGINRGEAVAAHIGSSVRRQYSLIGDTVNVGSRMCGVAKAGEIAFTSAVLDALEDPPIVEDVGPVDLKGVAPGLGVWRVPASSDPYGRATVPPGTRFRDPE